MCFNQLKKAFLILRLCQSFKDKTALYFVRGEVSLLYGLRDSINPAAVYEFRVAAILQLTLECNKSNFNEYS